MVEVLFLGVNDIGEWAYDWLTERDDADVLALVTEKSQLSLIDRLEPELVISSGFRHIVPEDYLTVPDLGAVNFHKAYLPYNRGANPNVWSIVEDAPAGVSLHYMTADVDAGPIIDRREVPIYPDDDGRSLYERLEATQREQFREVWPAIRDGDPETTPQDGDEGTYHYKSDFVDLWGIDRDATVRVGDFLDRLRALTFPPYKNAYFQEDGEKYHVEVSITPAAGGADEPDSGSVPGTTDDAPAAKNVPTYTETDQG